MSEERFDDTADPEQRVEESKVAGEHMAVVHDQLPPNEHSMDIALSGYQYKIGVGIFEHRSETSGIDEQEVSKFVRLERS